MADSPFRVQLSALHSELSRLAQLYQVQNREDNRNQGLSVSQEYAVMALARSGAMRMSVLAERLTLSLSATTKLIDGLEARGLVRRSILPTDRRVVNLRLTIKGKELFQAIHDEFYRHLTDGLKSCDVTELRTITQGLKLLSSAVEAWQNQPERKHSILRVKKHQRRNNTSFLKTPEH